MIIMDQENVGPERPLQEAVERQTAALDRVGQAVAQKGTNEEALRKAVEDHGKAMDEVHRELGRQDTGTLPQGAVPEPESPEGQPGLA